jgi:hypothetical protein
MFNSRRLLLTAVAIASLAAAPAAFAETCLRMVVSASGSTSMWNNEEPARQSAIAAWPSAATQKAGPEYASWALARGKNVSCAPVAKSTVRCTATATPCKP